MTETEPDAENERIVSVNGLAYQVSKLAEIVQSFVGGAHKDATATTEKRLDASTTTSDDVAEQARRAVEQLEREREQRDAADKERQEREQLKADVAALKEKPPEAPVRRVERIMGWRG